MYIFAAGRWSCRLSLLPEMYTFSLSASSDISFPKTLTCYFSVLQMLTRQLMDIPVHLGLEHYPNIYCGVAVFILIPLYVMNKRFLRVKRLAKWFFYLYSCLPLILIYLILYGMVFTILTVFHADRHLYTFSS